MSQALQQAVVLHQRGRLVEAERLYRETLRVNGSDFEALHMLGILKLQQGQAAEAVQFLGSALRLDRTSGAAFSNYGAALAAVGRHAEALASYDQALLLDPNNAGALGNRADALCDLGRTAEALASYDRALAIDPALVSALVNRAVLLRRIGRPADALSSCDAALKLDPSDAEAWNTRALVLQDLGRETEALASYDSGLALRPDLTDVLLNRGSLLLGLRRPADALASYGKVIALRPHIAEAHKGRGHALFDLQRFEEALASYDRAAALAPGDHDAGLHRARVLAKLDRHPGAILQYETLRKANAGLPMLLTDLAHCKAVTCDWSDGSALVEELTARVLDGAAAVDPFLFLGAQSDPQRELACARNSLSRKKIAGVQRSWKPSSFTEDKLRVAYLSADFHRHATTHLMAELFEIHDRRRFEILGISFGRDDGSALRARVAKGFDRFFDVTTRPNLEVAQLIRDLKTNIAVDLKGHTIDARIGILADRAAPVQVSYLGYPGTTGADFMDYIIADPIVLPLDQQPWYTERIIHLPDSYQVNDSKRSSSLAAPTRQQAGLPENGFVFCCFNNSWKINAPVFDVWMRLLRRVEGSVLWLLRTNSSVVDNLHKEAQASGVAPARLIFAPLLDLPDHLARHRLADLFLDTAPYNAHTTASDSLWAGVPIVTMLGPSFQGRVAASLLRAVELPQLATRNLAEYESLALRLATDAGSLAALRAGLNANRNTCALFDTDRFRRHLERAFETMWEIWRLGEPPKSFRVEG